MKPPQRKRVVSETFEATVWNRYGQRYFYLDLTQPRMRKRGWKGGDRVRVEVTKLERGK